MHLDSAHNQLSRLLLHRSFTHIIQVRRSQVRSHDDHRIPEVDDTALTVRQTTVVEDLQEKRDEFPSGFLDFVDEDDTIGFAADVFYRTKVSVNSNGEDESKRAYL